MGCEMQAECNICGHEFRVSYGGSMSSELLRCNRCGKDKFILFREIPDLWVGRWRRFWDAQDGEVVWDDRLGEVKITMRAITEKVYRDRVQRFAGGCTCRGRFRFNAPPRCPKCWSRSFTEGERPVLFYD